MSESDFDVIVVGAGCAGATAAYVAASAGMSVLMIERGNFAGAKNMTGGRIYAHALREVFPGFESEAPLERRITHERLALMDAESSFAFDFTSAELAREGADSYAVLRAPFDQWLAAKAEEAGAEAIYGIAVEELVRDDAGRVVGVRAGEDQITAQAVILSEGANPLLSERCLGNPRPKPHQMAVGIKQVLELSSGQIEDRFLLPEGEGASMLFVGDCTHGCVGGGFLYTNRDSISLGLVTTISKAGDASNDTPVYQMLEDLKRHPAVAPIVRGATVVEHSGHMVPEGGLGMVPEMTFDGCVVVGEAAGLCMNMGYQVRGMDFAVASGRMAAEAVVEAIGRGDTSKAGLAGYRARMEASFVMRDLRTFSNWPATMEGWDTLFSDYPTMVREAMNALFVVDGTPQERLMRRMMPIFRKRGLLRLGREMRGALKSL
ncbi:FAD-dependent oxidoreductase [Eggerthellaceae bacterium zg-1084]|uniref:FAD-dependent oxidoreductase n=1 Tax=Berryella wangjianweii TaxID=2734634 RepID=UPI001553F811|nr:FAD-dependent oxidoreductase [Berryella wangjianweii]NPD30358.1 FAD-dependent oxidoreductase [Berryella wangjianweii]